MWKDILKGEKVHPSVKNFISRGNSRIRKEIIKIQEDIEEAEEYMQSEEYEKSSENFKTALKQQINSAKNRVKFFSEMIGAKFSPQHDKFPMTLSQRLGPSTKMPVEREERPQAFSYNPDDTLDSNIMRRFNLSEEDFNEMSEKRKEGFREAYKAIEGDK
tara:strand:+ start:293 stop:772 length:480 start_codon:yes stop_codon:yes gene_type:complete